MKSSTRYKNSFDARCALSSNDYSPAFTLIELLVVIAIIAILASLLIVFALSIDDFVVTQYLSGDASTTTVSMLLYASARGAPTPALNALATISLAITLGTLALVFIVYRRFAGAEGAEAVATGLEV